MVVLQSRYTVLEKHEQKILSGIFKDRHGNIKASSDLTGLNVNTLKRAKDGLPISDLSASIIREKITKSDSNGK